MEKLNYTVEVIKEEGLSEKNLQDIKNLVKVCNEEDDTNLIFYKDGERENITKFLFYSNEELIAYFGAVPSYNIGQSYIWGTIHPNFRYKDVFSELFNHVTLKCKEDNMHTLNLINEREATSFGDFMKYVGGEKKYSTYKMSFHKEYYKERTAEYDDILLKKATIEDLDSISPIGMEAFETTEEEEREYNESNLKDSKYSNFLCKIKDTPVGIISARIQNGEGSIADLAVIKSYRGRGIGRVILSKTIAYLLNEGIEKFTLTVETENKNALSLYESSGFRVEKANDCYEMKI